MNICKKNGLGVNVMLGRQVIKFGITGCINSAVSYTIFNIFIGALGSIPHHAFFAQALSYSAGIIVSFILNSRWTFKNTSFYGTGYAIRFITLQILLLLASSLSLDILVDFWRYNPQWCWLLVMIIVVSINFVCQKHWVFGKMKKQNTKS